MEYINSIPEELLSSSQKEHIQSVVGEILTPTQPPPQPPPRTKPPVDIYTDTGPVTSDDDPSGAGVVDPLAFLSTDLRTAVDANPDLAGAISGMTNQQGIETFINMWDDTGTENRPAYAPLYESWGLKEGDPGFNPEVDINGDGKVDFYDFLGYGESLGDLDASSYVEPEPEPGEPGEFPPGWVDADGDGFDDNTDMDINGVARTFTQEDPERVEGDIDPVDIPDTDDTIQDIVTYLRDASQTKDGIDNVAARD